MAIRNLKIADKEWDGIDRLQIPTTEEGNPTATFYDTSDAATDEAIKKYLANIQDLDVYGQNGLIEGGSMARLQGIEANQYIQNPSLQLQTSFDTLKDKIVTVVASTQLVPTQGDSVTIEVSFNTALDLDDNIACTAIQVQNVYGNPYIYYKKEGEEKFTLAYAGNTVGADYIGWQGSLWVTGNINKIQLTEEPTGDTRTNLLKILQSNPDTYYAYLKTIAPVYIDSPEGEPIFAIPGLDNLLPKNVKSGTKISGITIDGFTFEGTLMSADIDRLSQIEGTEGYTTLVIK